MSKLLRSKFAGLLTITAGVLLGVLPIPASAGAATVGAGKSTTSALAGNHIQKSASNLCLVARAGPGERPVEQTPCADFSDQGWGFRGYTRNGETVYQIVNLDREKCIVTRTNAESPAVVSVCADQFDDQLWRAIAQSNGSYQFKNFNSNLCLVARGTSQAAQTTCAGFTDQRWFLTV